MAGIFVVVLLLVIAWWMARKASPPEQVDLSVLPERFVVFDLETTGLDSSRHEIIEIGAIRVNRDRDHHETFQVLVRPKKRISKRITTLTGLTNEMVSGDGVPLEIALRDFREFVGDLPLVAFNAPFDDAFLRSACASVASSPFANEVCCALKLARRAWPGRSSYKLSALARDGQLDLSDEHRAIGDCRRTMLVYAAAARTVGAYR